MQQTVQERTHRFFIIFCAYLGHSFFSKSETNCSYPMEIFDFFERIFP